MTNTTQTTAFGNPLEEQIHIKTTGRVIRPFKRMLDPFITECKLQTTPNGIRVHAVDSTDVVMAFIEMPATAFEAYDAMDTTLGLNLDTVGSALQHARYGKTTDDPITITSDGRTLETETTRELGGTTATIRERTELLDPDSIRDEPELPDLEYDITVDLDPETFVEAVKRLDTNRSDPIKLGAEHDSILLQQDHGYQKRHIQVESTPSSVAEWTLYSSDYVADIASSIRNGYVDDLVLKWSEEYPLVLEFSREDVYSGELMLAPLIRSE